MNATASLFVGAAAVVVAGFLLALLGGGVGLFAWRELLAFHWESLFPWTAVGIALAAIGSGLAGGYLAGRLALLPGRRFAGWLGLGVWVVAMAGTLWAAGPTLVGAAGAAGAGTQPGLAAIVDTIRSMHPRVVSDMSIFKGKIVSTVDLKHPNKGAVDRLEEQKASAKIARRTAELELVLFGALLLGAVASVGGTMLGARGNREAGPASREETPYPRAA